MYVQEKNKGLSMSQRRRFNSIGISGGLPSVATKKKQQNKLQTSFPKDGWQKDDVLLSRGSICYPMPPHGYGPAKGSYKLLQSSSKTLS